MKKRRSAAEKIDIGWRKLCGNHQHKNRIRIIKVDKFSQEENTELVNILEEFQQSQPLNDALWEMGLQQNERGSQGSRRKTRK